ncbi:hypothetical protein [Bdellovibrio sp. HCB337]|uniref:hypothetical protein n=1 Tax=Bdellovibrio sp. HCB337 TaxID=3394358 RepID=UPI0039A5B582
MKPILTLGLSLFVSLSFASAGQDRGNGGSDGYKKLVYCNSANGDSFPAVTFYGANFYNGAIVHATLFLGTDTAQTEEVSLTYDSGEKTLPPKESVNCGGDCSWYEENFELLLSNSYKLKVSFRQYEPQYEPSGHGELVVGTKSTSLKCTMQKGIGN